MDRELRLGVVQGHLDTVTRGRKRDDGKGQRRHMHCTFPDLKAAIPEKKKKTTTTKKKGMDSSETPTVCLSSAHFSYIDFEHLLL